MLLTTFKIIAALAAGATLLTFVGPVIGEVIATLPPPFPKEPATPLTAAGLPYEEVTFPTTGGLTLRGWFVPVGQPGAPAIVYAPATSHDQRSGLSLVEAFHEAGYHVLLFSYRGSGQSDGPRGRFTYGHGESRDVDAAVAFLRSHYQIDRIAVVGHSVGAVSAIMSAARNPQVGAVVAVAPFTCVTEVWHTSRPGLVPRFILDWTLWFAQKSRGFEPEQICPLAVVDEIAPRPLLVIHGTEDRRITEAQAGRLFAAAAAPKTMWLVEGASHSGIRSPVLDLLAPDVIAFLDSAWRGDGSPSSGATGLRSGVVTRQRPKPPLHPRNR